MPRPGLRHLKPNARSKRAAGHQSGLSDHAGTLQIEAHGLPSVPEALVARGSLSGAGRALCPSEAAFAAGRSVGEVARKLYDPKGLGIFIDVGQDGTDAAIARTRDLLLLRRPIFEAGFEAR